MVLDKNRDKILEYYDDGVKIQILFLRIILSLMN